jgi:hypothetical protein
MTYNTKHVCKYNSDDIFLNSEIDQVTKEEKEFILNMIYKNDLLVIFNLEEYNVVIIDDEINQLYEKLKNSKELCKCMNDSIVHYPYLKDEKFGLIMLFSFEYFYSAHKCISDYLDNGVIKEEHLQELQELLSHE